MSQNEEKHPILGVIAGIAGGLAAAWVMNVFSTTAGKNISQAVESQQDQQQLERQSDGEDATMKTADAIAAKVTGGQHLTHEQRETGGPVVHYTFAGLMGGLYGGLAEYSAFVRSGMGTTFGSALFVGGDLLAVPALHLSPPIAETPASSLASPYLAHLVYGFTMDIIRRSIRHFF